MATTKDTLYGKQTFTAGPAQKRLNDLVRTQRNRIDDAKSLSPKEAASEIADALRHISAEFPDADRTDLQAIMARCEAVTYQPEYSGGDSAITGLVKDALAAVSQLTDDGVAA